MDIQRLDDCEFKNSLGYTVKCYLKKRKSIKLYSTKGDFHCVQKLENKLTRIMGGLKMVLKLQN